MAEPESTVGQKDVAFYTAVVDAWVNTRMEKDRTLLALSTAGIGLLVTLLTTVGPSSRCELFLYIVAGAFFVVAIVFGIFVFDRNARYLRSIVVNNRIGDDSMLVWMDRVLFGSFLMGVLFTAGVALSAGLTHLDRNQEDKMEEKKGVETTATRLVQLQKSLTGMADLRPTMSSATNSTEGQAPAQVDAGQGGATQPASQEGAGSSGSDSASAGE